MTTRILHVVTYMGRGGLETMLMNYYRNTDRTKVQFDFLVHRDFEADYDREILSMGGRIYRLPRLNPFSKTYLNALESFFKEHNDYKIVHSHLDCMAGIPLKYAKKAGIPVRIAHAHSSSQTKNGKYILKLIFKKNITKNANKLFACGENAGKWMFNTDEFRVINNAIDTSRYIFNPEKRDKIRNDLKIGDDALVIGHVGRFAPPKNHKFIIDVFAELWKNNSKAVLLLVGDGELQKEARQQVQQLGIADKVIFTGVRSDVCDLLQAMDVFFFPSIYEGLPVSLIEAQTAGLPCVISDNIPDDCKITDLVTSLSLEEKAEVWAQHILHRAETPRKDYSTDVKNSGFDITETAKWLEDFYIEHSGEKENNPDGIYASV